MSNVTVAEYIKAGGCSLSPIDEVREMVSKTPTSIHLVLPRD